jgi:hypothetical protein
MHALVTLCVALTWGLCSLCAHPAALHSKKNLDRAVFAGRLPQSLQLYLGATGLMYLLSRLPAGNSIVRLAVLAALSWCSGPLYALQCGRCKCC